MDIANFNLISYFNDFLNLTKKLMKIGCSRNIEETTVVYAITVFHTCMSAHNWRYMYMYYSLIYKFICTCMLVDMYFFIRFYKRYGGKSWMHFHFVSTFLVFILESRIKMIFFLNLMMFICFMLQWLGQRLNQILHVKVWRWRNWKIDVHRNVLWKLQNEEILILSHQSFKI